MTTTILPFVLNNKPGVLAVQYAPNRSITESGFDLLAGFGFDVNMAIGYPTMRAFVQSYEGTGYYTASAWIQIITRREFTALDDAQPSAIVPSVDVNETLYELGVPFFGIGYPAEIYDAPCNNLGYSAKLEWIADTFFVTMPSRINNNTIMRLAGFQWGYVEFDLNQKRQVEIAPLAITGIEHWQQHLPLLRNAFSKWRYADK
jgi:hypothetical protein